MRQSLEQFSKLSNTVLASPYRIIALISKSPVRHNPSLATTASTLKASMGLVNFFTLVATNQMLLSLIITPTPYASSASKVAPLVLNLKTLSGSASHFSHG